MPGFFQQPVLMGTKNKNSLLQGWHQAIHEGSTPMIQHLLPGPTSSIENYISTGNRKGTNIQTISNGVSLVFVIQSILDSF